jgi:two-component system, sensor histidine kinase
MSQAGRAIGSLVLNVNDHDGVRYMTSRMLDRAGYPVVDAATGGEALRLVAELKPRLVILDIKLPDINGLEVCRQIKLNPATRAIKILHTSAVYVAPEAKVQSLNSGADSYLSHPYEQEELIATVRSLLRLADAEQRLRDTAAELQRANQRTHEFLAMLAHELRNPLSAIATSMPLLERQPPRDDVEKNVLEIMRRQTGNLRRLVEDLLDTARVTQGKIEPRWEVLDLVALLGRVTDNARRSLLDERQQKLELRLPAARVNVRGDSLRLEQVFTNLLDNASKYTDSGGRITVGMSVENATEERGMRALVTVTDTGIGLQPEALDAIFNLFSQAEVPLSRSRGGLGIGLTLVRTLVELHGGSVTARSEGVGKGFEIEVGLPVLDAAQAVAFGSTQHGGITAMPRRRILIVEDNLDAQRSLRLLLEMWGHDVTVACDGDSGVRAFTTEQPDIALVDIGLPGVDGYELARRVRAAQNGHQFLLIALSGYGAPDQRARALEAGFDLHLVKPVESERLARLISLGNRPAEGPRCSPAS